VNAPASQVAEACTPLVRQLGRVEYEPTWQAMQRFTAQRNATTIDEVWLCQHPPVFTQGMAGKPEHLLEGETPILNLVEGEERKTPVNGLFGLLNTIRELGRKGLEIQRYKGLGEMNPEQLWETTMNPDKRKMVKVMLEDAVRADGIFSVLMGDEVEPRRQFIEDNALNVRNLDI